MKFTCETKAFTAAMQIAARVIPAKSPWPILLTVKIVTNDNRITVTGSNVDTTFEMDVPAEVETEGATCIPFALLIKFVNAAKGENVSISEESGQAKISSGRNRITLMCGDPADYPNYQSAEGATVTLDAPSFANVLRYCAAAASTEESKYFISGVNFDEIDGHVCAWGTNGHLASRGNLTEVPEIGGGGTLPNEAVQIVLSVIGKAETIDFNINERGWSAHVAGTRVWGKVVDAKYPDMRKMLTQFDHWSDVTTIDLGDMQTGLSVGSVGSGVTSDKSNKIILKSSENTVIFRGGDPAVGVKEAGRAEVDAVIKGDFALAVNARYVLAALTGIEGDSTLSIRIADNGMQIEPSQSSMVAKLSSVILPMRVSDADLADV